MSSPSSSSSSSSGSCRRRTSAAFERSEAWSESGRSGCILLMFNGTPRAPWQTQAFPMPPAGGERGVHPDVRLWDACVLPFLSRRVRSPQACRRVRGSPVSCLLRGRQNLPDVPGEGKLIKPYHRTNDIIDLNAEALGWGWGVHSCRPR
ncbi:MAG: hypothetical protein DMG72_19385 [Acidobacteria bacterium]|nr:MAG: hypothetical protein DMG72_19385 [Acidobacteriota bacterium]